MFKQHVCPVHQTRIRRKFIGDFIPVDRKMLKRYSRILRDGRMIVIMTVFLLGVALVVTSEFYTGDKTEPVVITTKTVVDNPAIVWYTSEVYWIAVDRKVHCFNGSKCLECDIFSRKTQPKDPGAYLFYVAYIGHFPLPRNPKTIWGMLMEETPNLKRPLLYEEGLNLFNFSATYSRHSDVPFPLFWMKNLDALKSKEFFLDTSKKNSLLSEIAPVMYMQSDCLPSTERDEYVLKLMEFIKVDSYGSCIHNKDLPLASKYVETVGVGVVDTYLNHLYGPELLRVMAQYKFIVAIENGICNDYTTEKIWRALEVGVVPIYYGSPLIRDWLPNNKSAILLEDFPTPELLSQHLHYLLQNDSAYEEYLEHKTFGRISNMKLIAEIKARPYQTDLEKIIDKFECFICEKLHMNSDRVNIVTKKHFECPLPTSALTLAVNPANLWIDIIKKDKGKLDELFEEMERTDWNTSVHASNTSWW